MHVAPRARHEGVIAEPLDDDTIVYEADTGQAHRLGPVATTVWQQADGTRNVAQLAAIAGVRPRVVLIALAQLQADGLLEAGIRIRRRWGFGGPLIGAPS